MPAQTRSTPFLDVGSFASEDPSIQSTAFPSSCSVTARCVIELSGAAPCQCFTPAGIRTTSPGRISCISPPHCCTRPTPAVTTSTCTIGCVCQFERAPGDWDALLVREPRPDLALVSKAFPTFNLMRSHPGWSLVVEDQGGGLFVREDSKVAAAVRHAAASVVPPEAHCFAAARAWLGGSTPRPRAILGAAWPHP